MKQLTILSGKAMIVELPEGATNPIVDDYLLGYNLPPPEWAAGWGDESYDTINLPPGNWRIIGMLSEVTEEQAAEMVGWVEKAPGLKCFVDYKKGRPTHSLFTALESLESAILAEGYAWNNPYGETEPMPLLINTEEDKRRLYEDKIRWMTAQSRVLDRSRCLLLGRVDG